MNHPALSYTAGLCLSLVLCFASSTVAQTTPSPSSTQTEGQWLATTAASLEQEGQALFEVGEFQQAATVLQQAIALYNAKGDAIGAAISSSNLALVYEQLGQWSFANQVIATSLTTLQRPEVQQQTPSLLGQVLLIQGQLQLAQGQSQLALTTWQTAETHFAKGQNQDGIARSHINQAQALQTLGLSRRAITLLTEVTTAMNGAPPSQIQVLALRSLGDTLRATGELNQSLTALSQSLAMAEDLQLSSAVGASQLSLGNTQRALGNTDTALDLYQQAAKAPGSLLSSLQAQLNQLSLLVDTEQWSAAETLWPTIGAQLDRVVPSRKGIYAQLNLARSLIQLQQSDRKHNLNIQTIAQRLATALQQAQMVQDPLAESYVRGTLGALYEQTQQHTHAEALTSQALALAQTHNAPEILFRWQWQLGRILKAQGQRQRALTAYTGAIQTLKSLRSDLIATRPKIQFDFRDNIEPIHRQLVELLLELETHQPDPSNLETARLTIESLQLAELDNFFRRACLDANPILIDQIDRQAAVIYPIILPDQLAVIVSLPGQPLRFYSTPVSKQKVERTVAHLLLAIRQPNSPRHLPLAQQMYSWLLQPAATDLAQSEVKTLVFVLDGVLRNVPMAVLHDGDRYLVEQYGVALTPGLQLLEPRPLPVRRLTVLAAGISESHQNLPPLPYVEVEIEQIDALVPAQTLKNKEFTPSALQDAINTTPYPIVHLATHGRFSSDLDQTFLLVWDDKLKVNQLRRLLRGRELQRSGAIELLVLSACETAVGDHRAALGLAGIATRSGARSTLATLWQINDQTTAQVMETFYQALTTGTITKAEALRQAQQVVLKDPDLQHPFYWAAYVLVGNWL